MKNFVSDLFGVVFSTWTLLLVFVVAFGYLLVNINQQETASREKTTQLTEACYNQGMVLVDTDAGKRCAAPLSLVKVK